MNFSSYLFLDKRRAKKDKSYPIVYRIGILRSSIYIQSGFSVPSSDWDERRGSIKNKTESISNPTRTNNILKKKLGEIDTIILDLFESQRIKGLKASEIKKAIVAQLKQETTLVSLEELILEHQENLESQHRFGTAKTYKELKQFVELYHGTADFSVTEINYSWLVKIETKYMSKPNNSINGLGPRFRALRALLNHYNKAGRIDIGNVFEHYSIKTQSTRKRALTKDQFESIVEINPLHLSNPLEKARDYFLASYYLFGINFKDLSLLKISNIQNGSVSYVRSKTKKQYKIKISNPLNDIFKKYISSDSNSEDYIFPIVSKELNEKQKNTRIRNALARYNKNLRNLVKDLDIDISNITSYSVRHTVSTVARNSGIQVPIISQLLGHNDLKTTAVYLDSIQDSVLEETIDELFG